MRLKLYTLSICCNYLKNPKKKKGFLLLPVKQKTTSSEANTLEE